MPYDLLGCKVAINDPTRAPGRTTTTASASWVGRLSAGGTIESNTVWEYDSAAYGLGQLASVQDTQFGLLRRRRCFSRAARLGAGEDFGQARGIDVTARNDRGDIAAAALRR